MKDQRNLKAYYQYLQEDSESLKTPFEELTPFILHRLETSEGFKDFLIRGIWTSVIGYAIGLSVFTAVAVALYSHFKI